MKLADLCEGVYKSCPNIKSQKAFIERLFKAAGDGAYISDSYKKGLFNGGKPFSVSQKEPLRGKENLASLTEFFETEINDTREVLISLGIPEKGTPDKHALAVAFAQQMKQMIESEEEDVENILVLQYQQAKQKAAPETNAFAKPLYPGDSVSSQHERCHEIQSFEKVEHTWELLNTGNIPWTGRRLIYKRGPKDRPEANPSIIELPDVPPKKSIKITTTIDGRGFDGITHCIWEMQDSDGENCFPDRESLFCVTIDAKFKRK